MDATFHDVVESLRNIVVAALVLISVAGCSYDSDALGSVQCDEDGEQRDGKECRGGYWVATDSADADVLSDVSDTDTCIPPTDDALCQTHHTECGSLEAQDPCGQLRTLDCGECSGDQSCDDGTCRTPGCDNGAQTGEQTDVDCGGPNCGPCDVGLGCELDSDCISGVCDDDICAEPSCDDGVHNGDQTDIDCGGPNCEPCDDGLGCDIDADCVSGVCDGGACAEPSCDDGVQNADQTDVDCGGSECDPCPDTKMCDVDADCISGICGVARTDIGLISSYDFETGDGDVAYDQSASPTLNLTISDEDDAQWHDGALELEGAKLSHDAPGALYDAFFDGGVEFSVELWVEAANTSQDGPARLFSLSDGTSVRNFTIGADEDILKVRLRHAPDTDNGTPAIVEADGAVTTQMEHYVVTVGFGYLRLYRNGVIEAMEPVVGDLSNWDHSYPLVVGDEIGGGREWEGIFHHLAVYDRALIPSEIEDHYAFGPDAGASGQVCRIVNPYVREAAQHDPILVYGQHFHGGIVDRSGNQHHGGLYNGARWQISGGPTEAMPGYLSHQRVNQSYTEVVDHPDLDLTGSHTIAYWRRRHGELETNWEADFAKGNEAYQVRSRAEDQTRLSYDLRRPGGEWSDAATPEDTMELDDWQFVVVVYDRNADEDQMASYVDDMDEPAATTDHADDIGVNNIPLTIAAHRDDTVTTGRHADLDITGFTIFDQVLDAYERQELMDAGE